MRLVIALISIVVVAAVGWSLLPADDLPTPRPDDAAPKAADSEAPSSLPDRQTTGRPSPPARPEAPTPETREESVEPPILRIVDDPTGEAVAGAVVHVAAKRDVPRPCAAKARALRDPERAVRANSFAAHFLLPTDGVQRFLNGLGKGRDVSTTSRHRTFGSSEQRSPRSAPRPAG